MTKDSHISWNVSRNLDTEIDDLNMEKKSKQTKECLQAFNFLTCVLQNILI